MKAIALYTGVDSYCRHQEVAVREDGVQFHRHLIFNGYGKVLSRWRALKDPCKIVENRMEWGFKSLYLAGNEGLRLRLPKEN